MCQFARHRQLAQACFLPVIRTKLMRRPCTRLAMADSQRMEAAASASAEQPASTVQNFETLKLLLSKQSVKVSTFKVIVCNPRTDTYEYEWEGKPRESTAWRCVLVSADDPMEYCLGEYKKTVKNKASFDKHVNAYRHGTTLVMKAVSLVDNAKTQYNNCSVRVTVNMASTTLSVVLGSNSAVQPVPRTTVAQTTQLEQDQNFDLTALILSRSQQRPGGDGRKAFDLELADGSTDEASGKVQTLSLTLFAPDDEFVTMLEFADKAISDQVPVSFFNLRGAKVKHQDAFTFSASRKGFSMIIAESPKALDMKARAPALYNLEEKTPVPQTQFNPNESFSSHSATLTTIKCIKDMATPVTGVEEIDSQNTLWQLNWVQVLEPAQGTTLRTQDGSRLWFPVILRDFHGSTTMYITEAAALKCSKQADVASFEDAHKNGRLCFPIVSSVKIMRKKAEDSSVNFYVVDCEDQRYESAPTTSTLDLLKLLPRTSHNASVEQPADTFVAAMLADIRASAFYPLTVRYAEQALPETLEPSAANVKKGTTVCNCTSILALVSSTKPSQKETMNEKGTTVTTKGVKDLLANDGREYTLTAHCTTDTYQDFLLTPPKRAKQQTALVVIRGTLDDASAEQPVHNFLVESLLPLHDDDANVAKASLLKLISLMALAGQRRGEKRENSGWSQHASPAKIAKCRTLTRYPTGDEIPAYSHSS
jgi:hypothetical protein